MSAARSPTSRRTPTSASSFFSLAGAAPILLTPRLRLRGHVAADFDAIAAMWADERVVRAITGRPSSREESWARLLRYGGLWAILGFGYWLVEDRASGAFLGEVGLADFKRDLEPSFDDAVEAGWVVHPATQGRGIATEAMLAALAWSDRQLAGRRVVCMIAPENAASFRVAEKCGFVEFARTEYRGNPTALMVREPRRATSP
jgi:RimJ/RimL family protein N-acetyltransferase